MSAIESFYRIRDYPINMSHSSLDSKFSDVSNFQLFKMGIINFLSDHFCFQCCYVFYNKIIYYLIF